MTLYPFRFPEDYVKILSIGKIVVDSGLQLPSPTGLQHLILCKSLKHGNIPATVIMPYAHYQGVTIPEIYFSSYNILGERKWRRGRGGGEGERRI